MAENKHPVNRPASEERAGVSCR